MFLLSSDERTTRWSGRWSSYGGDAREIERDIGDIDIQDLDTRHLLSWLHRRFSDLPGKSKDWKSSLVFHPATSHRHLCHIVLYWEWDKIKKGSLFIPEQTLVSDTGIQFIARPFLCFRLFSKGSGVLFRLSFEVMTLSGQTCAGVTTKTHHYSVNSKWK